jgi:hypothetical protein
MVTHQVSMIGGSTIPDSTAWFALDTDDVRASNDVWNPRRVPQASSTPRLRLVSYEWVSACRESLRAASRVSPLSLTRSVDRSQFRLDG